MSDTNVFADHELSFSRVFDFSGQVVLVTGAACGIGKVTAERSRERGAQLAPFDKSSKVASIGMKSAATLSGKARIESAPIAPGLV